MDKFIEGIPREQIFLFNECLDEVIEEDNIVRFIDAYVESLDLGGLGFKLPKGNTGTPPYRPQLKLKIYIYGYFEKIRSSRKLEKECKRNRELIWLTESLAPDFKTIADFRKDNPKALKNLFKEFLRLCHKLNLISFNTVAIDGTKIRGQNSQNEVYKRKEMERIEKQIQDKIDQYLKELDEIDKQEKRTGFSLNLENVKEITKKLEKQKKRKGKIERIKEIFNNDTSTDIYFATDQDCTFQSDKGKIRPGYNAQIAVDDKNKLIVINEITNEQNDQKQLTPMVDKIKEQKKDLNITEKTNSIADAGYFTETQIMGNKDDESIQLLVPPNISDNEKSSEKSKNRVPLKGFRIDDFCNDKERDIYICPMGQELTRITKKPSLNKYGNEYHSYQGKVKVCLSCDEKMKCSNNKRGRILTVSVNREEMLNYLEEIKTQENKKLLNKRKEIVEHPFGTIKRNLGYTHFLLKGIEKVSGEFSLICLIYNIKRMFNIISLKDLKEAIKKV